MWPGTSFKRLSVVVSGMTAFGADREKRPLV
jgi:hypothetical protein